MMNQSRALAGAVWLAAATVFTACSYDDMPANSAAKLDVTPSDCSTIKGWSFVQSTLLPKCSGSTCHDAGNERAVVVLAASTAYESTVNVDSRALPGMKLIEPGSPSRSFLYRKLSATQDAACQSRGAPAAQCGAQMPLNDWFALPEEWVEETRAWIACGAKR